MENEIKKTLRERENKPCRCRNTDYWADDTVGTNSLPAEVST